MVAAMPCAPRALVIIVIRPWSTCLEDHRAAARGKTAKQNFPQLFRDFICGGWRDYNSRGAWCPVTGGRGRGG